MVSENVGYLRGNVGIIPKKDTVDGVQFGAIPFAGSVEGVQLGLMGTCAMKDFSNLCVRSSGISYDGNVSGFQGSLIAYAGGNVSGVQAGLLTATACTVNGSQYGLFVSAYDCRSVGRQFGLLLWGPGNAWWNPSVGYQRLEPGKKVKPLGTLEKLVKKLFGK